MVNDLDYESNELLDSKKDFGRIEKENKFALMCFLMKIIWFILFIYQIKKLKDSIELLMIKNKNKSHYVCTKDFNRFICNKTRWNNKKPSCKYCSQCFCSERGLVEHKETCLNLNDKQSAKLRSCSIKFKNYFKQLAVLFNVYGDFECNAVWGVAKYKKIL